MLGVPFLQEVHLGHIGLHDEAGLDALLLNFLVLPEIDTTGNAREEQSDRCHADTDLVPQPIHEVGPFVGGNDAARSTREEPGGNPYRKHRTTLGPSPPTLADRGRGTECRSPTRWATQ